MHIKHTSEHIDAGESDPLSAARGVLTGILFAVPFWIVVLFVLWWEGRS